MSEPSPGLVEALLAAIAARDPMTLTRILSGGGADAFDDDEQVPVALHAADTGDVALVQSFLDAGAAVDIADERGWTLLFSAVAAGSLPLVEFLIARGADPSRREDLNGDTVLTYALGSVSDGTSPAIVSVLLRAGADPSAARSDGWTPLMLAAQGGSVEVARALLEAGAEPHAAKDQGTTAAAIAQHWQRDEIAELLAAHGSETPVEACLVRLRDIWGAIGTWFAEHDRACHEQLVNGRGADPEAVQALATAVGQRLPADLQAHLLLYGAANAPSFVEYQGLSAGQMVQRWRSLEELRQAGTFVHAEPKELPADGQRVQYTWWHPGWLPFAEDSGGNLYCVDLAPAEYGTRGQVIAWEVHSGPVGPIASSLEDYLRRYRDRLTSE